MNRKETKFSTTSELWGRGGCHCDGVVPERSFIHYLSKALWWPQLLVNSASSNPVFFEEAVALSECGLRALSLLPALLVLPRCCAHVGRH